MGTKFKHWKARSSERVEDFGRLSETILRNREFQTISQLDYGDHGLFDVLATVTQAIQSKKRIALYADYDVDGTMSCVSWIWFLQAIGFDNYIHYIPCRFREGYGLNLDAVKHLIEKEKAELIITMDTGITANEEAAYCKERGVQFICTDHHKIQPEKMPDCLILNPKLHPDPQYQELCGCGVTFVLLRKLAQHFEIPKQTWTDILSLAGMATICDVVPLNGVNHKLARLGVASLMRSERPILKQLRQAALDSQSVDERDVGFRLGPRINAVGRLDHANQVIEAFLHEDPQELIAYMDRCNLRRRELQKQIILEATEQAKNYPDDPILFLGGDWHPGVVGIAASKIVEQFWKPTWLFCRGEMAKGSARSIPEFDVTTAMQSCGNEFTKFGGHRAAGGFSFEPDRETTLRKRLNDFAIQQKSEKPEIWESHVVYDCELDHNLLTTTLLDVLFQLKPFGHAFEAPTFSIQAQVSRVQYYNDKISGEPKHSAIHCRLDNGRFYRVVFFDWVISNLNPGSRHQFVVSPSADKYKGETTLSLFGLDYQ